MAFGPLFPTANNVSRVGTDSIMRRANITGHARRVGCLVFLFL